MAKPLSSASSLTWPRPMAGYRALLWPTVLAGMLGQMLFVGNLAAQTVSLALDQVVVSGTRTQQSFGQSPVRVDVVDQAMIERYHARTVHEALQLVPGLLVQKMHGKEGYEVWLQGIDSDRVLILLDGQPVSASSGTTTDVTQMGSANIKRIEIVKGATSALYGSNAIGGVVNVITRRPTAPFTYTLRADLGSYADQNPSGKSLDDAQRSVAAYLSFNQPVWFGEASLDMLENEGFALDSEGYEQEGAANDQYQGHVKIGARPTDFQEYVLSLGHLEDDSTRPFEEQRPGAGGPIRKVKVERMQRTSGTLSGNWLLKGGSELKALLFQEDFTSYTEQDVITTAVIEKPREAELQTRKFMSQWDIPIGGNNLTFGLDGHDESLYQISDGVVELDPARPDRQAVEAFFQYDMFVSDRLRLLPGFRYQHDSDFGHYTSPSINGRWELDTLLGAYNQFIRFGVGRGYRVPSLKERYFVFDHSDNGYMIFGSNDLQPEASDSLQLGWVLNKGDSFYLDLNLFLNRLNDFIDTGLVEAASSANDFIAQYRYINVSRAETRGGEITLSITPIHALRWQAGYTYLEAIDRDTGDELPKRPNHQIKLQLDWQPWGDTTTVSAAAQWQSTSWYELPNVNRSPAWSRLDIKLNHQLSNRIKVFGGIDNLTNTQKDFSKHFDVRPEAGRFIYTGFQITH